jgi:hypothetical protein
MYGRWTTHAVVVTLVLAAAATVTAEPPVPTDTSGGIERLDARLTHRIVALLPTLPAAIWVVDAEAASPAVRQTLLKLDAFVLKDEPGIYLVKQSRVLQGALEGSGTHECMLASIVWHEMAHLEGADEREAQRREEVLWTGFMLVHRVDGVVGLRYLEIMKRRRSPVQQRERFRR